MSDRRLRVVLLMGGISGEHSISIRSAATVAPAIEAAGYEVVTVGVTRSGRWLWGDFRTLLKAARTGLVELDEGAGTPVCLAHTDTAVRLLGLGDAGVGRRAIDDQPPIDAVFPVLHGPGGEDGSLQGFLETIGVPYVGAGCRASALAMDKLAMKTLCAGAEIPQVEFVSADGDGAEAVGALIARTFGYPCFVKPANLGSSVGISRVASADTLADALVEARRWDSRVVVERGVDAREIEVALLGDETRVDVSPPGEIVTPGGFYDFNAKYVGSQAGLIVPADVTDRQLAEIRAISARVWALIGCRGMARADFFIERSTGHVLFNELNTIPGFTKISMYPRLWAETGMSIEDLVGKLIGLALQAPRAASGATPGAMEKRP